MTRTQQICAICLVLLLFVFCLMGCQTPNAKETDASDLGSAETYTFTDALGQEITIERPERVVSLMGSFSEIWVLAGGADTLVGTSEDTTDTRDLGLPEDVASVGTYQNPLSLAGSDLFLRSLGGSSGFGIALLGLAHQAADLL